MNSEFRIPHSALKDPVGLIAGRGAWDWRIHALFAGVVLVNVAFVFLMLDLNVTSFIPGAIIFVLDPVAAGALGWLIGRKRIGRKGLAYLALILLVIFVCYPAYVGFTFPRRHPAMGLDVDRGELALTLVTRSVSNELTIPYVAGMVAITLVADMVSRRFAGTRTRSR